MAGLGAVVAGVVVEPDGFAAGLVVVVPVAGLVVAGLAVVVPNAGFVVVAAGFVLWVVVPVAGFIAGFAVGVVVVAAGLLAGFAGLMIFTVSKTLSKASLIPHNNPLLKESVIHIS